MNCRRVERRLSDYLEGLLSPRRARFVTEHLDACASCRRLRDEHWAVGVALRAPLDTPPMSGMECRVAERWIAERVANESRRPITPAIRMAAASAVVLACLVAVRGFDGGSPGRLHQALNLSPGPSPKRGGESLESRRHPRRQGSPSLPRGGGWGERLTRHAPSEHANSIVSRKGPGEEVSRRQRLMPAPSHPDDLAFLNRDPARSVQLWGLLPRDEWAAVEKGMLQNIQVKDDFVQIPPPRLADATGQQIAAAVETYKREAAVVDARVFRKVTLALKATALSDLCDLLRRETGIVLSAGQSVADEKVTLFCKEMPLREVMRQLTRPFGYTWLRSGKTEEYKYELVQDLRSQLLEEELRNRDRNAALIALEREIDRYRPYLSLSPDDALAKARTAPPNEKRLLEKLGREGWGPIQIYFRLSMKDLETLRAGQTLTFSQEPKPGEQPLPPDVARGVLQIYRDFRFPPREGPAGEGTNESPPVATLPDARGRVTLTLKQSELGRFILDGESGVFIRTPDGDAGTITGNGPYAVGIKPAGAVQAHRAESADLARDPTLRQRISIEPQASCRPLADPKLPIGAARKPKLTSADVLEAVYRATGAPIIADYYTHLYEKETVSVHGLPLLDALDRLADAMRLRWLKDGAWLQFRSITFYDDRRKEVPNRLLMRWATSRRQHGALPLDEVLEIAQLADAQLDATGMAEGARECFGLLEWGIGCDPKLRPHLRCLAQLSPAQRQSATSPAGLPFGRMTLAQQQQFVTHALDWFIKSLDDLAEAVLRVGYTQPGAFGLKPPDGPWRQPVALLAVRDQNWAEALRTARRIDPRVGESQIAPTELAVTVLYTCGGPAAKAKMFLNRATPNGYRNWFGSLPGADD